MGVALKGHASAVMITIILTWYRHGGIIYDGKDCQWIHLYSIEVGYLPMEDGQDWQSLAQRRLCWNYSQKTGRQVILDGLFAAIDQGDKAAVKHLIYSWVA